MKKVITYGTYDLLHYGHIRLLKRAKALGDYLIVGITSDDFDKARGKINVQQSLMERIEGVRATGIADEIIIEEYEGQKIDDIKRLNVDIFTVGSDWRGKFDYLNEFCKVIYLDRTSGVSSSEIRGEKNSISIGLVGESNIVNKFASECSYVNGVSVSGVYSLNKKKIDSKLVEKVSFVASYDELLEKSDALYIASHPKKHFEQIERALECGKHVICESPIALKASDVEALYALASEKGLVLSDGIKTAFATAYERLLLLLKSGVIGDIVSVDATCTSLRFDSYDEDEMQYTWPSMCSWGPFGLLPIFQILGTDYVSKSIVSRVLNKDKKYDLFSKISFIYPNAVASVKVGEGVKSEGEMIISGTKGYVYIPAPWWKTDYFEIRYENAENNKRYFYQLEGEGIRYEIATFINAIRLEHQSLLVDKNIIAISEIIESFEKGSDVMYI